MEQLTHDKQVSGSSTLVGLPIYADLQQKRGSNEEVAKKVSKLDSSLTVTRWDKALSIAAAV
jgi:hypothetical protein